MFEKYSRRRYVGSIAVVASYVALSGCSSGGDGNSGNGDGGGSGEEASEVTVDMTDSLGFDPESVTVSVGDTVTWENVGSVGHSVTAYEDQIPDDAGYFASGGFDSEQGARDAYFMGEPESGDVPGGESWSHTFGTVGTYEYFCIPHESAGMVGTIEVTEG